jgi:hypothetical protein
MAVRRSTPGYLSSPTSGLPPPGIVCGGVDRDRSLAERVADGSASASRATSIFARFRTASRFASSARCYSVCFQAAGRRQ